jgi:hypothetical protein
MKCFKEFDLAIGYDPSITYGRQWAHVTQKKVDEWKEDLSGDVTDEPILGKPDRVKFKNEAC